MFKILVCMFNIEYKLYVGKMILKRTKYKNKRCTSLFINHCLQCVDVPTSHPLWTFRRIFSENRTFHAPSFSKNLVERLCYPQNNTKTALLPHLFMIGHEFLVQTYLLSFPHGGTTIIFNMPQALYVQWNYAHTNYVCMSEA